MGRERWVLDGYELTDGTTRDVEKRDGMYGSAALEGSNAQVANRRGTLWRRKQIGEAGFALNCWMGAQGGRENVDAVWDDLMRVLTRVDRLIDVQHTLADGSVRECWAEPSGTMEPTPYGQNMMRFGAAFRIPAGVWYSLGQVTDTLGTAADGAVLSLTQQAPSTAPMDEGVITITGPINSPIVTAVDDTSEWVKYTGNVPSGATLVLNCRTWSVTGTGWTPTAAAVSHGGSGGFLTVPVALPGQSPRLRLNGSGIVAGTTGLRYTSKRMYRTG